MAGLDNNMLKLIKALSENRIQDAKDAAIICCICDNTKKNEHEVNYYQKLLKNGSENLHELPTNLTGLLRMEDVSGFREDRYYLGTLQKELYEQIEKGVQTTVKMLEYGIPYLNSTLLYGEPGTGKTEFAKYVAYKLGLPYAYINFSHLIESYMGKTAQNLQRIFDYCKGQKCVLMLDEIDCIGIARGNDTGCDGELARTTIALMQSLDSLVDGQILIAATNRDDRLDKALLRRFQRTVKFESFDETQTADMIKKFMKSVDEAFLTEELLSFAKQKPTQAETIKHLIDHIVKNVNVSII